MNSSLTNRGWKNFLSWDKAVAALLILAGVILRILPNMFTIKGEVATRSSKVMNGVACKQSGTVTFKRHPRDPFWRLLDNENPCTGEREVIELRMDAPPPRPQAQKAHKRT